MRCEYCGERTETHWDAELGDLCADCARIVARERWAWEDERETPREWYLEQEAEWAEAQRWARRA
jgi:ribosome-binding protein aMBF1 (putative translation factor)